MLAELKAIGVKLALDDFGTGYSSLAYLRRYPLDVLKIDKSFVEPLGDPGDEGTALMATIIQFARTLGLHTVAEGIEHPVQQEVLATLACDTGQGCLLSEPLDGESGRALIASDVSAARKSCPPATRGSGVRLTIRRSRPPGPSSTRAEPLDPHHLDGNAGGSDQFGGMVREIRTTRRCRRPCPPRSGREVDRREATGRAWIPGGAERV